MEAWAKSLDVFGRFTPVVAEGNVLINKVTADYILESCRFPEQRKITPHHVEMLGGMMVRGEWWENDQITFCRLPNGNLILVNGYHRMTAVSDREVGLMFNVRIIDVNSMDDVRRCYVSFDTMGRKRSETEVLDAMGIQKEFGLKGAVAAAVYRSIPILANKFYASTYQTEPTKVRDVMAKIEMSSKYWATAKIYQDAIDGGHQTIKRKLLLANVTAVAMVTLKHQEERAYDFWRGVALLDNIGPKDVRKALHRKLMDTKYSSKKETGKIPLAANDAAVAWNAFFSHRELTVLRISEFKLLGTPWR